MATVAKCKRVVPAQIAHPFGDERSVNQAFPAGIPAEEAGNFAFYCNPFALTASLTAKVFFRSKIKAKNCRGGPVLHCVISMRVTCLPPFLSHDCSF